MLIGVALVVLSVVVFMPAYWSYQKANNPRSFARKTTVAAGFSLALIALSCVAVFLFAHANLGI